MPERQPGHPEWTRQGILCAILFGGVDEMKFKRAGGQYAKFPFAGAAKHVDWPTERSQRRRRRRRQWATGPREGG